MFIRYFLYVRTFAKKLKYSEETFGAFFVLHLLHILSTNFPTFSLFVFLLIKFIPYVFNHWFNFWFKIFILWKCHSFFWFRNSNFLSGRTFRKISSILFKTRFVVSPSGICWRGCFLFLRKRSIFFHQIVIFSWVVELLEKVLAFPLKLDLVWWSFWKIS